MDTDLLFGDWLKRRRRRLGLTQVELGRRTGYAGETIRKVEANEARPSYQMADKLAHALDVPSAERARFLRFARGVGDDDDFALPTQTASVPAASPWGGAPAYRYRPRVSSDASARSARSSGC